MRGSRNSYPCGRPEVSRREAPRHDTGVGSAPAKAQKTLCRPCRACDRASATDVARRLGVGQRGGRARTAGALARLATGRAGRRGFRLPAPHTLPRHGLAARRWRLRGLLAPAPAPGLLRDAGTTGPLAPWHPRGHPRAAARAGRTARLPRAAHHVVRAGGRARCELSLAHRVHAHVDRLAYAVRGRWALRLLGAGAARGREAAARDRAPFAAGRAAVQGTRAGDRLAAATAAAASRARAPARVGDRLRHRGRALGGSLPPGAPHRTSRAAARPRAHGPRDAVPRAGRVGVRGQRAGAVQPGAAPGAFRAPRARRAVHAGAGGGVPARDQT